MIAKYYPNHITKTSQYVKALMTLKRTTALIIHIIFCKNKTLLKETEIKMAFHYCSGLLNGSKSEKLKLMAKLYLKYKIIVIEKFY